MTDNSWLSILYPTFCKAPAPESQTTWGRGLYPHPIGWWGVNNIYWCFYKPNTNKGAAEHRGSLVA